MNTILHNAISAATRKCRPLSLASTGFSVMLMGTFLSPAFAAGTINRDLSLELRTLDVQKFHLLAEEDLGHDLFEGLTTRDKDGVLKPGVAKEWTVSDDGKTYTFTLNDTKWSNGDPLTAKDFVFAFRRILEPSLGAEYASLLYPIANAKAYNKGEIKDAATIGVKAVDDHTLEITLASPTPYFPDLMANTAAFPLHAASVEKLGSGYASPGKLVSNGAFMLESSEPHGKIVLKKNPEFFDASAVSLDGVVYNQILDGGTAVRLFRAGELDITPGSKSDGNALAVKEMPDSVRVEVIMGTEYYDFGLSGDKVKDPDVRLAINMAIDRAALTEDILGTNEVNAYSLVPPGLDGYESPPMDFADKPLMQRVEEAQKLMQKAGFGPNKHLKLEVNFNSSDLHNRTAVALSDMLKDIWIDLSPVNRDGSAYWEWLGNARGKFDLARDSWIANFPDPVNFLNLYYAGKEGSTTGYSNAEYDKTLDAAALELDKSKRFALLAEAERMLLTDGAIVPLYYYNSIRLVNPKITGWNKNGFALHPSRYLAINR
ncbi:peptide ABC transporter substrate-binding protein [Phyllobacterium sophorae]|uniref:ABC transporter substrate-binding protein n=1 Tax=Phyllobacterium sophorae TaxID=1520277 RepID=A0A2P7BLH9_9HYPH|nr:peptide ABC transporter substrate-binding protein [Phyllobacterium sophorae]PSH67326.1 ABC transporter substrate-binding protein [Phyllobacterium sophorae]